VEKQKRRAASSDPEPHVGPSPLDVQQAEAREQIILTGNLPNLHEFWPFAPKIDPCRQAAWTKVAKLAYSTKNNSTIQGRVNDGWAS
jgi:hypothetical protein